LTIVAYVRVSSTGQNLDAQLAKVEAGGAEKVFKEKRPGVDQRRSELARCLDYLRDGDTLLVTKADRVARSSADLLTILQSLAAKGVEVKFLDQPQLNSGDKYSKFMLMILAGVAELEREIIRERQADGIKAARERGVRFGRKPKVAPETIERVKAMRREGLSIPDIGHRLGLGRSTIYRALG